MKNETQQVKDWMRAFGQATPEYPQVPSIQTQCLRLKLIKEEMDELEKAFDSEDLVEIADAVADLLYVVLGAGVAAGIQPEQMEKVWQIVCERNLRKFWSEQEIRDERSGTTNHLPLEKSGVSFDNNYRVTKVKDNLFVVRNNDGKIIKSPSWVSPYSKIEEVFFGIDYKNTPLA